MRQKITFFLLGLSLFLVSCTKNNPEKITLQILQTSDTHGKFMHYDYPTDSESKVGSLVQVATLVKKLRQENNNTILMDAGDTIQDNSNTLFLDDEINPMIIAMNYINYDIWSLGNHDFNYGMNNLFKAVKTNKATSLSANLYKDGKRVFDAYKIIEKGGVKVLVIGAVTPYIAQWDPENLKGYDVTNPIKEIKQIISEQKDNADLIIVNVHMSLNGDYGGDAASDIAKENPEVAVIFIGHAHAVINERVNDTLMLEPGKQAEYLSKALITMTKENGKWILKDKIKDIQGEILEVKDTTPDAELVKILTPQNERAIADTRTIIGELQGGDLVEKNEILGIPESQLRPSALITLIQEVQEYYTKADIAVASVFRSDANIKMGKIKKADAALVYKYDNTLIVYELTGSQLKKYMEWSAQYFNQYKDGDLTISFNPEIRGYNYDMFSGVQYEINISKPIGSRIENLRRKNGVPVKDTEKFTIAVNDYRGKTTLAAKETGLFKEGEIKLVKDLANEEIGKIRDLIVDYIKNVKRGVIKNKVNNNFKITGTNFNPALRAKLVKLVNEGKISVPMSQDGRTPNITSITESDIKDL